MQRVVLDTCVLVPGLKRDFLLELAVRGAFMPLWSSGTLQELIAALERLDNSGSPLVRQPDRRWLIRRMMDVFPGSTIDADRDGHYAYGTRDQNDAHVAHAAATGAADSIVTDDLRAGFDRSPILRGMGIRVLTARAFGAELIAADQQ